MRPTILASAILAVGVIGSTVLSVTASRDDSRPRDHERAGLRTLTSAPISTHRVGTVNTEAQLRSAWSDPQRRHIDLGADIALRNCQVGDPIRESPYSIVVDGHGHVIRQTCFEKRLLRQDGTGFLELRDITLTRGGADGPGAAVTSRGEIAIYDSVIKQNLSEEPGGGVFSMRKVTVHRSRINGNLANDDGGGVYARRGGVEVYDSVLSNNLVDGSGGAIGSTGDILVVRSQVDGNTTDGDGGALYTDEDGDVTVVDSLIDGSDADGPGGAIFTLDGDVAVLDSTLTGNRADDRGGAVSGEGDVLIVNSTVARNLAVAHAGGGIWARGNLMLVNATVTDNYAEGEGGGTLAAGTTTLLNSTLTHNIASVGANVGSAGRLHTQGSIIGPATTTGVTGDTIPTRRDCRVYDSVSGGHNFLTDESCELEDPRDVRGTDPELAQLEDDPKGFVLLPRPGSPVLGRVPSGECVPPLPAFVPAGQLLAPYLDWDEILRKDAVGTPRDTGSSCDIGAVEFPTTPGPAPRSAARAVRDTTDRTFAAAEAVAPPRAATRSRASAAELARRSGHALRSLDVRLRALQARVQTLQHTARRFDVLRGCTTLLPVDRLGDPGARWGFRYDERDGTGVGTRTALALHPGRGRATLSLLDLSRRSACLSRPVDPNGAGDDARLTSARPRVTWKSVKHRLAVLQRAVRKVDAVTGRYDEWESCLSWLPVTEDGDRRQDLGFLMRRPGSNEVEHGPAIDLDHTEWDDPDYQLLAFVGRNRPFGGVECQTEPGESADRVLPRSKKHADRHKRAPRVRDLRELRAATDDAREDIEDLAEPVDDIARFDQCMFTVGARSGTGYSYQGTRGAVSPRSALSFDLSGHAVAPYDLMAFPGEEPPQIECNEDAGGQDTEE